ncbi:MAG: helix-turn-helix transcriptional regulator [Clostridia bacterium]|nr:helix-turn-helix transcriptional regulator [Clostridia bacterium]
MKLLIAERIVHYRKLKNMTQESLAGAVGVSAQAVSGWERSCGYPDITLLPGIAHTLGITIDELMGNDEIGVREDIRDFYERFWKLSGMEKLALAAEYYHKYPDIYDLADTLISTISEWGFADNPEHFRLLREACEKVIEHCTDNDIRCRAIAAMSYWSDDSEAERWLAMNPAMYSHTRGEVLEERLMNKGRYDEMRQQKYKNNLTLMLHLIGRQSDHLGDPAVCVGHNTFLRKIIRTFGENGTIPDGWVGKYAFISMRQAAGLFGMGKKEEGFALFEEAMNAYKKQFSLPDEVPLDLGAPAFFGGIALKKHHVSGMVDSYTVSLNAESYYIQNPPYLYDLLTRPHGWEWFDSVRDDERFIKAVADAKALSDSWRTEYSSWRTEHNG